MRHATSGSASSFGRRMKLLAAAEKAKAMSTRSRPRIRMRRKSPNSLPQPKPFSIRFQMLLADALAHGVAGMTGRAPVEGGASPPGVAGDVRRHVHGPQLVHEVLGVIALVGSERDAVGSVGPFLDHASAAVRSAWPLASVTQPSTMSPWRFSEGRAP